MMWQSEGNRTIIPRRRNNTGDNNSHRATESINHQWLTGQFGQEGRIGKQEMGGEGMTPGTAAGRPAHVDSHRGEGKHRIGGKMREAMGVMAEVYGNLTYLHTPHLTTEL